MCIGLMLPTLDLVSSVSGLLICAVLRHVQPSYPLTFSCRARRSAAPLTLAASRGRIALAMTRLPRTERATICAAGRVPLGGTALPVCGIG